MDEVERSQPGVERGDMDARQAAVLGRERVAPDDPDRAYRDAILGRWRDIGQERDAAAVEGDITARDGRDSEQRRRNDILGRGRDTASERGQGRDRER